MSQLKRLLPTPHSHDSVTYQAPRRGKTFPQREEIEPPEARDRTPRGKRSNPLREEIEPPRGNGPSRGKRSPTQGRETVSYICTVTLRAGHGRRGSQDDPLGCPCPSRLSPKGRYKNVVPPTTVKDESSLVGHRRCESTTGRRLSRNVRTDGGRVTP